MNWLKKKLCISRGSDNTLARIFWFSFDKGYLTFTTSKRELHGISTRSIDISVDQKCFGGKYTSWLIHNVVGYNTVAVNWAISFFDGKGFMLNTKSKELINLHFSSNRYTPLTQKRPEQFSKSKEDNTNTKVPGVDGPAMNSKTRVRAILTSLFTEARASLTILYAEARTSLTSSSLLRAIIFKLGLLLTSLFLFFTSTTLVHFTLRETQERMLKFTFLLQHQIRNRIPYATLVLQHLIETIVFVPVFVGVLFFFVEFYADRVLAFMVISLVWLSEVYCIICIRTWQSLQFFPRIFFLLFSLYNIYFFSFPFGFSYLALLTTVLFVQYSMLVFWNRFEVPALASGHINPTRPRFYDEAGQQDSRTFDVPTDRQEGTAPGENIIASSYFFEESVELSRRIQQQQLSGLLASINAPYSALSPLTPPRSLINTRVINELSRTRALSTNSHDFLGPQGNERRVVVSPIASSSDRRRRTFTSGSQHNVQTASGGTRISISAAPRNLKFPDFRRGSTSGLYKYEDDDDGGDDASSRMTMS